MGKAKPCAICGKPTEKAVLQNSPDETAICSSNCQTKYIETLSFEKAARLQQLIFIDDRISSVKKYETYCWAAAGLGLTVIILGVVLTRMLPVQQARMGSDLFLIGAIPLTLGAIATEHFIGIKRKLIEKKQEIA